MSHPDSFQAGIISYCEMRSYTQSQHEAHIFAVRDLELTDSILELLLIFWILSDTVLYLKINKAQ